VIHWQTGRFNMSVLLENEPAEEIVRLPDRYEVIDGEVVEMPPMSAEANGLSAELSRRLANYGESKNLGMSYPEVLVQLPLPADRRRRPDVIFVPFAKWPKGKRLPTTNEWFVLPDLCVEVVSPTDLAVEAMTKVHEYFASGVKQVWIVYPKQEQVHVFESPAKVSIRSRDDVLDGGTVIPGLQLPLSDLFTHVE